MRYPFPFRRNTPAWTIVALALAALLASAFWWNGGLPVRELPRGSVTAFLEGAALRPSFGGKVFCAPDVLGTRLQETAAGPVVREYAYARCQEFYPVRGRLELGSGASVPVIITARRAGAGYSPVGYQVAPDGGDLEMFPPIIRRMIGGAERSPAPPGLTDRAAEYFRQ